MALGRGRRREEATSTRPPADSHDPGTSRAPDGPPRGAVRLMLAPDFAAIFWGKLFASIAVWLHSIVAAIVVYDATGSAVAVGCVSVAQFGPQLVLTPWAGSRADRGNPVVQIFVGRLTCVLGSGALAVWLWAEDTASGPAVAAAVIVASLVVGLGFVLGGPAMQSMVPRIVTSQELSTAVALNTLPLTAARIGGPALGAVISVHLGAAPAFATAAGLHLLFAVLVVIVKLPGRVPARPGVDYSIRTAIRYVAGDRVLLLALVGIAAVGFGSEPSLTLAPSMAEELTSGGGGTLVGWLTAGFGLGAAVGLVLSTVVERRLGPGGEATAGLCLLAGGFLAVALAPGEVVAVSGLAVAGMGFSWAMTGFSLEVQRHAPPMLLGRIMAFWLVGFVGARPVAAGVLGGLADVADVRTAFVGAAGLLAVAAVLCSPALRSPRTRAGGRSRDRRDRGGPT